LIGPINVLGMAPERAQSNLKSRYSHFIKNPEVGIKVENQRTLNVSILGSVHKPGPYPLAHSGNFLTEILSEAGGRTPQAGTRIILLPSQKAYQGFGNQTPVETLSQENSRLVEVDFEQLTGTTTTPPIRIPLRPGDTIIIPEAGTYEVDGEVAQPGSYKLTSRTSVMGAIAAARGLTYAASVNNIELIRDVGGGKKALISLDLEAVGLRGARDIRLRTGDLVRVPSEPKKFFKQQIVQAINGLFNGVGVNQRLN
jgi:polysaccharide export outer membrane protein